MKTLRGIETRYYIVKSFNHENVLKAQEDASKPFSFKLSRLHPFLVSGNV